MVKTEKINRKSALRTVAVVATVVFAQSSWAHLGHTVEDSQPVCDTQATTDLCGSEKTALSGVESDHLHELEHWFSRANIVAGPSIVDCTLSAGTATRCFSVSVKAEPLDYMPGPWCPESISDGPDSGGIWFGDNQIQDVDGDFIKNLAAYYNDSNWQLFDESTGKINVTNSLESCEAAARPDVDPAYQNHCVQCLPEYMADDASVTYIIPLNPVPLTDTTVDTRRSGSGVAFNGIRLDGPAPVGDILSAYTLAPFDDCGGHVNLHVGYHYHVATDCLLNNGQSDEHGTVVGLAMDGRSIYARHNSDGEQYDDLDDCGGHLAPGQEYHYHAGEPGSNAIVGCFTAETGCVFEGIETSCDASARARPGGDGRGPGNRPDFSAAATSLGVSESALMKALGGPPPDFENAAKMLGIDVDALREAIPSPVR